MKSIGREIEWELEYVSEANWIAGVRADIGQREENEWAQKVNSKPRLRTYLIFNSCLALAA